LARPISEASGSGKPITARPSVCAAGTSAAGRSPKRPRRPGGRTHDLLARYGIERPTITGAGTGTFEFEAGSHVYTELPCGSYIFTDADYGRNRDRDGEPTKAFEPSLFVWATVMSRPTEDRAIVDAGLKALAFDSGPPLFCDEPRRDLRASLGRARPARRLGRHQPARARRQDPADPRPLRPDRQPPRLVCLCARQSCRTNLTDRRPRRGVLTLVRRPVFEPILTG
jgi:D-serine deaminase-like pyridoxal phosphate-dependent protein